MIQVLSFFDVLMSNRELFVETVLVGVRQDPNAAEDLQGLGSVHRGILSVIPWSAQSLP